ncbi:hypothetical protein ACTZWW_08475 [Salinarimonas sp. NSM]|uniref:hypothetical protein n=1 Tax=Salinarimonas sp. NSM TaxID=3458003 RepID=UPI00403696E6
MSTHPDLTLPTPALGARTPAISSKAAVVVDMVVEDADGSLRELPVESWLERKTALVLTYRQDVVRVVEQSPVVRYLDNDSKPRRHTFDFLATFVDGRRIAFAVKPAVIAERKGLPALVRRIAAQMPRSLADGACLVTENDIDPVDLRNAELMDACRLGDPADDAVVLAAAQRFSGAVTMKSLVEAAGIEGRGYRAAMRLLASGSLQTLRHQIIGDHTLVAKVEDAR